MLPWMNDSVFHGFARGSWVSSNLSGEEWCCALSCVSLGVILMSRGFWPDHDPRFRETNTPLSCQCLSAQGEIHTCSINHGQTMSKQCLGSHRQSCMAGQGMEREQHRSCSLCQAICGWDVLLFEHLCSLEPFKSHFSP